MNIILQPEQIEQKAVIDWCHFQRDYKQKYVLAGYIYAIPNEGKRSRITGAIHKMIGLKPGMPDLCLPIARGGYGALYIEMKVGKNKSTPKQVAMQGLLREAGNRVVVCHGSAKAIAIIEQYLEMPIIKADF